MTDPQNESWRYTIWVVLLHPQQSRVWLQERDAAHGLPQLQLASDFRAVSTAEIVAEAAGLLGVPVYLLHRAYEETLVERRWAQAVYLFEAADTLPNGGVWAGSERGAEPGLPEPIRETLRRVFSELETGQLPQFRAPWAQRGWYARMLAWLEAALAGRGEWLTRPIAPIKVWSLSCVLQLETSAGSHYFKAVLPQPLFVNEPVVIERLATAYPHNIPSPLAVNAKEQWMLLPDLGELLGWSAPVGEQKAMLTAYASLQQDAADRIEQLLAWGCIDRRLNVLAGQLPALLAHREVQAVLSAEEMALLHSLTPRLLADCARLGSYRVPETLGHGDLHGSNVARLGEDYYILDWTDACVNHPFIDMIMIPLRNDAEEQAALRDHYLGQWVAYETPERLCEAWNLAQPLMCLHQAISYQSILDHIEPDAREDLAWGPPFWLRKLLALYAEQDAATVSDPAS